MGLHAYVSFKSAEGFPITDVYCRISQFTYIQKGHGQFYIHVKVDCYLNRACRVEGMSSLRVPGILTQYTYDGPFEDMAGLYAKVKATLEAEGMTVEDVIECDVPEPVAEPVAEPEVVNE